MKRNPAMFHRKFLHHGNNCRAVASFVQIRRRLREKKTTGLWIRRRVATAALQQRDFGDSGLVDSLARRPADSVRCDD